MPLGEESAARQGSRRPRGEAAEPGPPEGKVTIPDVLLQPHSAPLRLAFNEGGHFPPAWKGDAFVALHGSWNRKLHTGYGTPIALRRSLSSSIHRKN